MAPLPQLWSTHGRLVVRHTFLDLVEDEEEEEQQPCIQRRSHTDSALWKQAPLARPADRAGPPPASAAAPAGPSACEAADCGLAGRDDVGQPQTAGGHAALRAPETSSGGEAGAAQAEARLRGETRTTVMLRNVPNNYTRRMLLEMLDDAGFAGRYDFVYLPMDFSRGCGLGYAFVNLTAPGFVQQFRRAFEGFSNWAIPTAKICQVTWSEPHQGLKANIKRYRNSPVMHPSVPEEYKPCLFEKGQRVPFPAPGCRVARPQGRATKA